MGHPSDFQYYLDSGCTDVSGSLGIHKMPDGYALMLDADRSHFFWMEKATGAEGAINWNKWAVRRGAIAHRNRAPDLPSTPT